ALEKRRCKPERMNRGTDVVNEAGQRQFRRPRSATDGVPRFNHTNGMACPGNFNGRRQTVRAGPDHHRIEFHRVIVYAKANSPLKLGGVDASSRVKMRSHLIASGRGGSSEDARSASRKFISWLRIFQNHPV